MGIATGVDDNDFRLMGASPGAKAPDESPAGEIFRKSH